MNRPLTKCSSLALTCALLLACGGGEGADEPAGENAIRVNQVGYAPAAQKLAVVVDGAATTFSVVDAATGQPVVTGRALGSPSTFALSGEEVRVADFSDVTAPGTYRIEIEGLAPSHEFAIGSDVYRAPALATLKAYYYWRASTPLESEYAGRWARAAGHPNFQMEFMGSSFESTAPKATALDRWDAPGGWYDAGDYGQYVVNAGITVGSMLALYELSPGVLAGDVPALHLPESSNGKSDLLDEVKWELDWLLRMQDEDGGVFFKLAGTLWPGWDAPADDPTDRVVIGKSTTSALDFAAVLAQAGRVYEHSDAAFAARCTGAARRAYAWALEHDDVRAPTDPGELTGSGPYEDGDARLPLGPQIADEFAWAAAELYITTRDAAYLADANLQAALDPVELDGYAGWRTVKNLAYYSLATSGALGDPVTGELRQAIREQADAHIAAMNGNGYRFPLGHYSWGSASQVANVGVVLLYAARFAPDGASAARYRDAAIQTADSVLGKNPIDTSFLTGFGHRTPMHIHHRPSEADAVEQPVPGLLTGGPNSGLQDLRNGQRVAYDDRCSEQQPAFCYTDMLDSYSSNEPAINQNAAALFLLAGLDALLDE